MQMGPENRLAALRRSLVGLVVLVAAPCTLAQVTHYEIPLAPLVSATNANLIVENNTNQRPVTCGALAEQEGCVEPGYMGAPYALGIPLGSENFLLHPPVPTWGYTRVTFRNLNSQQNGTWQADSWVLTTVVGMAETPGSNSDGVDVAIYAVADPVTGCESQETLIYEGTFLLGQDPRYLALPLPRSMLGRGQFHLALEVRPRGNNFFDHIVFSRPTLRSGRAQTMIADRFSLADVIDGNGNSLSSDYASLIANWSTGGAAVVPPGVVTACTPLGLPGGNNSADHTIVMHPPGAGATRVRMTAFDLQQPSAEQDWIFTARAGLALGSGSTGARLEIHASGLDRDGSLVQEVLGGADIAPGEARYLTVPLKHFTASQAFEMEIVLLSNGSAAGDQVIIEDAAITSLAMSHGLEHVIRFMWYFGFQYGDYPSRTLSNYDPSQPQFDDIENHCTHVRFNMPPQGPLSPLQFIEARDLGLSIVLDVYDVFFVPASGELNQSPPTGSCTLSTKWECEWLGMQNYLDAPIDPADPNSPPLASLVEWIYMEEMYGHGNGNSAEVQMVVNLIRAKYPHVKFMFTDFTNFSAAGLLPFDAVGFEGIYPTSGSANLGGISQVLNSVAAPGQELILVPGAITPPVSLADPDPGEDSAQEAILQEFLLAARLDERYRTIIPYIWWNPDEVFDNGTHSAIYDVASTSAWKQRFIALGRSIKERYRHRDHVWFGSGAGWGCAGPHELSFFSTQRLTASEPYTIALRGALPNTPGVLALSPLSAGIPSPFGCGTALADPNAVITTFTSADHMGRHFWVGTGLSAPYTAYLQAGYFDSSGNLVLTNAVSVRL